MAPGLSDFIALLAEESSTNVKGTSRRPLRTITENHVNKVSGGVRMSEKVSMKTKKKRVDYSESESDADESSDEENYENQTNIDEGELDASLVM